MSAKKSLSMSRRNFLKLAGLSTAGITLAACTPATPPPAAATAAATNPPEPTKAPTATNPPKPTVAPTATVPPPPPVELLYLFPNNTQADRPLVQDAMNEILKAKINATIKLQDFSWADFNTKIQLMNSSGEKYDLAFTSFWYNIYEKNVQDGVFVAVDDLLKTIGKDVYASMNAGVWKATKIDGKTYAVPNNQIMAFPTGFDVRKDLADKYGLDVPKIKEYAETEPFLAAVKAGENMVPIAANADNPCGQLWKRGFHGSSLDNILGAHANGYTISVHADDPQAKAFSIAWEDDNFGEAVRLARKWYLAGYYDKDITPNTEVMAAIRAGKKAIAYNDATKPGNALEKKASWGFEMLCQTTQDPVLNTSGIRATMTAIGVNAHSAEAAMRYLNEINTNVELYNLLCKGIEGKHWVWVDKAKKVIGFPAGVTAQTSGYNPNTDWMFGNQFNAYYVDIAQVGAWEETQKINDTAFKSVLLGFSFNQEPVKTEIAQVQAAAGEMEVPLMRGMLDPETALPKFQKSLKDAGIDVVIAEMQKQIDAWLQANT